MTTYVLFILLLTQSPNLETVEFDSKLACEAAITSFQNQTTMRKNFYNIWCVKK